MMIIMMTIKIIMIHLTRRLRFRARPYKNLKRTNLTSCFDSRVIFEQPILVSSGNFEGRQLGLPQASQALFQIGRFHVRD